MAEALDACVHVARIAEVQDSAADARDVGRRARAAAVHEGLRIVEEGQSAGVLKPLTLLEGAPPASLQRAAGKHPFGLSLGNPARCAVARWPMERLGALRGTGRAIVPFWGQACARDPLLLRAARLWGNALGQRSGWARG